MAQVYYDRVLDQTTGTGLGDFTSTGTAVVGYRTLTSVFVVNDTFDYFIEAVNASGVPTGAWEIGNATYSSAGVLSRSGALIYASSNADALVNFGAGTKRMGVCLPSTMVNKVFPTLYGSYDLALGANGFTPVPLGGNSLVALGGDCMSHGVTGTHNVAVGVSTMSSGSGLAGSFNVAVGNSAGGTAGGASFSSTTCVGHLSGNHMQSGANQNVFVGHQSGTNLYYGADNTVVGALSLAVATGVDGGTYVGENVAASISPIIAVTTCIAGTAYKILNPGTTTWTTIGSSNNLSGTLFTATGAGSGTGTCAAQALNNVAVGKNAGSGYIYGNLNTAIGYNAGNGFYSNGSVNSTCLGAGTTVTGSNQVQLGDSATTTYVYGTVQNRSDLRDKADVRDTVLGTDFIMGLRPVDYRWDLRESYIPEMPAPLGSELTEAERETHNSTMAAWFASSNVDTIVHDGSKKRSRFHHGFIAQEVKQLIDATGTDFGGFQDHSLAGGSDVMSVGYDEIIAPLVKAFQELKQEFDAYKQANPNQMGG